MKKLLLLLLLLASSLSAQTFVYSGTRKDYTVSSESGAYGSNSKILAVSDGGTKVTLIYYGRVGSYKYYGVMETHGTLRSIQTPDGRYQAVYSQAYSDETMDYGLHLRGPYSSLALNGTVLTFPRSLVGTERYAASGISIETAYALSFDRRRSTDAFLSGSSPESVRDAFVALLRSQGYSAL
ncbi:MAG: hypothetical protein RLZZ253_520 [Verrucomicrobiota bacterium]